jgi:ABC-2 type transport system ATP-binding protein
MDEVEAVCNRVAIIDRGRMLTQGTLDELLNRARMVLCVTVGPVSPEVLARLRELAIVRSTPEGGTSIQIDNSPEDAVTGAPSPLRRILGILEDARIPLRGIESQATSLESLFLKLTGRTLRD